MLPTKENNDNIENESDKSEIPQTNNYDPEQTPAADNDAFDPGNIPSLLKMTGFEYVNRQEENELTNMHVPSTIKPSLSGGYTFLNNELSRFQNDNFDDNDVISLKEPPLRLGGHDISPIESSDTRNEDDAEDVKSKKKRSSRHVKFNEDKTYLELEDKTEDSLERSVVSRINVLNQRIEQLEFQNRSRAFREKLLYSAMAGIAFLSAARAMRSWIIR